MDFLFLISSLPILDMLSAHEMRGIPCCENAAFYFVDYWNHRIKNFIASSEFRDIDNPRRRYYGRVIGRRYACIGRGSLFNSRWSEINQWILAGGDPADVAYGAAFMGVDISNILCKKSLFNRDVVTCSQYAGSIIHHSRRGAIAGGKLDIIPVGAPVIECAYIQGAIDNGTLTILKLVAELMYPKQVVPCNVLADKLHKMGRLDLAVLVHPKYKPSEWTAALASGKWSECKRFINDYDAWGPLCDIASYGSLEIIEGYVTLLQLHAVGDFWSLVLEICFMECRYELLRNFRLKFGGINDCDNLNATRSLSAATTSEKRYVTIPNEGKRLKLFAAKLQDMYLMKWIGLEISPDVSTTEMPLTQRIREAISSLSNGD